MQELDGKMAKALDVSNARSKTDIAKVQDMQDLWNRFTARLEYRLKLGKMYFDFHRHRQLVGTFLGTLVLVWKGKRLWNEVPIVLSRKIVN